MASQSPIRPAPRKHPGGGKGEGGLNSGFPPSPHPCFCVRVRQATSLDPENTKETLNPLIQTLTSGRSSSLALGVRPPPVSSMSISPTLLPRVLTAGRGWTRCFPGRRLGRALPTLAGTSRRWPRASLRAAHWGTKAWCPPGSGSPRARRALRVSLEMGSEGQPERAGSSGRGAAALEREGSGESSLQAGGRVGPHQPSHRGLWGLPPRTQPLKRPALTGVI